MSNRVSMDATVELLSWIDSCVEAYSWKWHGMSEGESKITIMERGFLMSGAWTGYCLLISFTHDDDDDDGPPLHPVLVA